MQLKIGSADTREDGIRGFAVSRYGLQMTGMPLNLVLITDIDRCESVEMQ